jgi:hypothetical protein
MHALLFALLISAAPIVGKDFKLSCPVGSKQVGGPHSAMLALTCARTGADGNPMFVGPYYSFFKSGAIEAVGQLEDGFRSGKWSFYDEKGVLVGDTEFKRGDFHGRRVFYRPDGSIQAAEVYVDGRRQLR